MRTSPCFSRLGRLLCATDRDHCAWGNRSTSRVPSPLTVSVFWTTKPRIAMLAVRSPLRGGAIVVRAYSILSSAYFFLNSPDPPDYETVVSVSAEGSARSTDGGGGSGVVTAD